MNAAAWLPGLLVAQGIFGGLAWFEWHGAAAGAIAALLAPLAWRRLGAAAA